MTYEEGIRYFKNHIQSYCVTGVCKEAEDLAIEALKKQVPMKPKVSRGKFTRWYNCSACKGWLKGNEKFCDCGQKISWED